MININEMGIILGVRSCPQVINTSLSLSTIQIHVNWCLINIVLKKYSAVHHQTLYIACSCVAHLTVQIMGHSDVWKASNSKNAHMMGNDCMPSDIGDVLLT